MIDNYIINKINILLSNKNIVNKINNLLKIPNDFIKYMNIYISKNGLNLNEIDDFIYNYQLYSNIETLINNGYDDKTIINKLTPKTDSIIVIMGISIISLIVILIGFIILKHNQDFYKKYYFLPINNFINFYDYNDYIEIYSAIIMVILGLTYNTKSKIINIYLDDEKNQIEIYKNTNNYYIKNI